MVDTVTPKRRSEIMSNIRAKGMKPEMIVRRLVHSMGYRYRLHRKDLPGKPDLVFPGQWKVIFVHGCFWHQHRGCVNSHFPRSNQSYWTSKLEGNRKRDKANRAKLTKIGWRNLVIWECGTGDQLRMKQIIRKFLDA